MKRQHLIAGLLAMTGVLPASSADAACLQPIYVIAHRCNDPNDGPMTVADEGVNAIEADFSWGSRGFIDDTGHDDEWAVDHDGVLPHSTYLDNWLNDVSAEVARPGTTLSLVILDIKVFQDIGIPKYWYGDGLAAAFVTPDSVRTNVADGIALRDGESDCGAFHGVYTWTYETEGSFGEFIFDYGVNGIFVNTPACNGYASPATADDPELAIAFAKARVGRKFATPTDNPFEHVTPGIVCPDSAVVECSGPGGTSSADRGGSGQPARHPGLVRRDGSRRL